MHRMARWDNTFAQISIIRWYYQSKAFSLALGNRNTYCVMRGLICSVHLDPKIAKKYILTSKMIAWF